MFILIVRERDGFHSSLKSEGDICSIWQNVGMRVSHSLLSNGSIIAFVGFVPESNSSCLFVIIVNGTFSDKGIGAQM